MALGVYCASHGVGVGVPQPSDARRIKCGARVSARHWSGPLRCAQWTQNTVPNPTAAREEVAGLIDTVAAAEAVSARDLNVNERAATAELVKLALEVDDEGGTVPQVPQ